MPRLLELFSGKGSIGRAFEAEGWEVVSLDLDRKFRPTVCCDVMQLDERSGILARPQPAAGSGGRRPAGASHTRDHRQPAAALLGHGEPADGPSQDAGVHAEAALQRRVLLQLWVQVQEGHKDLAQLALGALSNHVPQGRRPLVDGIHPETAQLA